MKVVYSGPLDGVVLLDGQECARGETVEVDDELGKQLLEQNDWTAPRARSHNKKEAE